MMKKIIILLVAAAVLLTSCSDKNLPDESEEVGETAEVTDIGFEHVIEDIETNVTVACTEGTQDAYKLENGVLTFSGIKEDSVYTVSGNLGGHIVIDVAEDFKFELVLHGAIIQSAEECPIIVKSADKVTITAKKDTSNFIYDLRDAVDSSVEGIYSGAIHAECDMQVGGKGSLTVESKNNNGIHSKDDLEVQNLDLTVTCIDNALKGNDSVTVESGNIVLISRGGDGIKTSNSDISDKGNQRGDISILGGRVDIYSACDGIDASHDVTIEGEAVLNIYTDKYSEYSEEVTAVAESKYYILSASKDYSFSVKYINDAGAYVWKNAELDSESAPAGGDPGASSGGRPQKPGGSRPGGSESVGAPYCFYTVEKPTSYTKMQIFIYAPGQKLAQESEYAAASEVISVNDSYDMIVIESSADGLNMGWSNYSTSARPGSFPGGPGGMGGPGGEGNRDKSEHSAKGIKAANEIFVKCGAITVKAYDDAIHANADSVLENGKNPTGNVTVSGGVLTIHSNDDGIHADGVLTLSGGSVTISNSYEGAEGSRVIITGGSLSLSSRDDGINATSTSGVGVEIKGGDVYIYASGDGIDSNSRSSYQGIVFSGGKTVVISTSGGNSAIDTEQGYDHTGGYVLAVMPSGGMSSEAKRCKNFNSVAQSTSMKLNANEDLKVGDIFNVKIPTSLNALVIFIGDTDAKITAEN